VKYKDSKDHLVKKTAISLIPDLAACKPVHFTASYLNVFMPYLLNQLKKDRDRGCAYRAIGSLSLSIGSEMSKYLDSLFTIIKESLQARSKTRSANDDALFECIGMLAVSVGASLARQIHEILALVFTASLTEAMIECLISLSAYIPSLVLPIQHKLLEVLSVILCHQSYKCPGDPATPVSMISKDVAVASNLICSILKCLWTLSCVFWH
jgi:FKBP12-rapamycin complex-associated protein